MREFKFRAWVVDSHGENMHYGCPFVIQEYESTNYLDPDLKKEKRLQPSLVSPSGGIVDVMQYTGLQDKNGKEIYEGDIVQIEPVQKDDPAYGGGYGDIGVVDYADDGFRCLDRDLFDIAEGYHGDCFIIGNIYENPELLDKSK